MIEAKTLLDNIKTSEDPKAAVAALKDVELIEVIKLAFAGDRRILMQVRQFERPADDSDEDSDDKTIKDAQRNGLKAMLAGHIKKLTAPKVEIPDDDDDTEETESERTTRKYDEAIEQINDGMFRITDINELLHLNVFTHESRKDANGKDIHLYEAFTFIAYALPKLKDPLAFLDKIKEFYGDAFLKNYLFTPLLNGENPNSLLDIFSYISSKNPEFWKKNVQLRISIETTLYGKAKAPTLNVASVNTHTQSIHRSADESHVTAFKLLLNANDSPLKDVVAQFQIPREVRKTKAVVHKKVAIQQL